MVFDFPIGVSDGQLAEKFKQTKDVLIDVLNIVNISQTLIFFVCFFLLETYKQNYSMINLYKFHRLNILMKSS